MINSRKALTDYCLRQLGSPVLQINVAPEQLEDRLDDAFQKFWDFHGDGAQRQFVAYVITAEDLERKYIEISDYISSVMRVMPLNESHYTNLQYTAYISDLIDAVRSNFYTLHEYVIRQMYYNMVDDMFNYEKPIRHNRYSNVLNIDMNWDLLYEGKIIVIDCYMITAPADAPSVYNDAWLKAYTTALFKKQWAQNLIKYQGFQLPSGIVLDGRSMFEDAKAEIEKLESDLYSIWQYPPDMFVG